MGYFPAKYSPYSNSTPSLSTSTPSSLQNKKEWIYEAIVEAHKQWTSTTIYESNFSPNSSNFASSSSAQYSPAQTSSSVHTSSSSPTKKLENNSTPNPSSSPTKKLENNSPSPTVISASLPSPSATLSPSSPRSPGTPGRIKIFQKQEQQNSTNYSQNTTQNSQNTNTQSTFQNLQNSTDSFSPNFISSSSSPLTPPPCCSLTEVTLVLPEQEDPNSPNSIFATLKKNNIPYKYEFFFFFFPPKEQVKSGNWLENSKKFYISQK